MRTGRIELRPRVRPPCVSLLRCRCQRRTGWSDPPTRRSGAEIARRYQIVVSNMISLTMVSRRRLGRILSLDMRIVRYWLYFKLLHRRQLMAASGAVAPSHWPRVNVG